MKKTIVLMLLMFLTMTLFGNGGQEKKEAVTDQYIKNDIVDLLAWDSRVGSSDTKINVKDGVVEVSGNVANYTARNAVIQDITEIDGVVNIEAAKLKMVNPVIGGVAEYPKWISSEVKPDDVLLEKVLEMALKYNDALDGENITISAKNGEIGLTGVVNTIWKKYEAENFLEGIYGVRKIKNDLTVALKEEVEDKWIAEKIKEYIGRKEEIDSSGIDIKVEKGTVSLSGEVDSYFDKVMTQKLVEYTYGVKKIENNLTIESTMNKNG